MSTVMKSMEEVLKISVDEDVDLEHVAIVFNPVMERFELIVLSDLGVLCRFIFSFNYSLIRHEY